MSDRNVLALLATALLWLGCGTQEAEVAEPEEQPAAPISGMYEVRGETVAIESGHKRQIAGTVILAEHGETYTATFDLATTYPGAEEALPAEVIGKGEGTIEGRTLRGSAQTQLVMATVPGIDPGFAFVPRMVSTRLISKSVATVANDGAVSIEIENEAAPGESYASTRTTLSGIRVSAAGIGGMMEVARERSEAVEPDEADEMLEPDEAVEPDEADEMLEPDEAVEPDEADEMLEPDEGF
jgi:hypothetical protein